MSTQRIYHLIKVIFNYQLKTNCIDKGSGWNSMSHFASFSFTTWQVMETEGSNWTSNRWRHLRRGWTRNSRAEELDREVQCLDKKMNSSGEGESSCVLMTRLVEDTPRPAVGGNTAASPAGPSQSAVSLLFPLVLARHCFGSNHPIHLCLPGSCSLPAKGLID